MRNANSHHGCRHAGQSRSRVLCLRLILVSTACIATVSCSPGPTDSDKVETAADKLAEKDWPTNVAPPYAQYANQAAECFKIKGCEFEFSDRLRQIAEALKTCENNPRKLCVGVRKDVPDTLREYLPTKELSNNLALPDNPFYSKLNNELLDAQAPRFGYRSEVFWLTFRRWLWLIAPALLWLIYAIGKRVAAAIARRFAANAPTNSSRYYYTDYDWLYEDDELEELPDDSACVGTLPNGTAVAEEVKSIDSYCVEDLADGEGVQPSTNEPLAASASQSLEALHELNTHYQGLVAALKAGFPDAVTLWLKSIPIDDDL